MYKNADGQISNPPGIPPYRPPFEERCSDGCSFKLNGKTAYSSEASIIEARVAAWGRLAPFDMNKVMQVLDQALEAQDSRLASTCYRLVQARMGERADILDMLDDIAQLEALVRDAG